METFERPLRKVMDKNGRLKEYSLSLGVNTEINEDRFYKNDKGKYVCDVLIGFADEFQTLMDEYDKFKSENESQKSIISSQKKEIEKLEKKLSAIEEEHKDAIKNKDDEYSAMIDKLNEDIHDKDLEIEKTRTEYEKKIAEMNLFDEDKHMLIKDHDEAILKLTKKISSLRDKQFNSDYHMTYKEYVSEISGIKNQINRQTLLHNDHLNELENHLGFWQYVRGGYKSALKDLKGDVEDFQDISKIISIKEKEIPQEIREDDEEDSS